jgi:hypothetical protein
MSGHTETTKLVRHLRRQGYSVGYTRGGHWRALHPSLPAPVFFSSTPGCSRAIANTRAMLRRSMRPEPAA